MKTTIAADVKHVALASAWARYNDPKGRALPKRVECILRRLSAETLTRMLAMRGIRFCDACGGQKPIGRSCDCFDNGGQ